MYICSMLKINLILVAVIGLFISCSDTLDKALVEEQTNQEPVELDLETKVIRTIEAQLAIPATEKYNLQVYSENLDDDGIQDFIYTVNRMQFAMDEAQNSMNSNQRAQTGFMGNYNYVVYVDGATEKISRPIPIGSSALLPLRVQFENIQTTNHKDALVRYRVRDAAFENYFFVTKKQINLVLQHKIYDKFASENPEFYFAELGKGSASAISDIIVHLGQSKTKAPNQPLARFDPIINPTESIMYHFIYSPTKRKYVIEKE
jgi:hypothetical protein